MEIGHALARVGRLLHSHVSSRLDWRVYLSCSAPPPMCLDPAHVSVSYYDVQPVLLSAIS